MNIETMSSEFGGRVYEPLSGKGAIASSLRKRGRSKTMFCPFTFY